MSVQVNLENMTLPGAIEGITSVLVAVCSEEEEEQEQENTTIKLVLLLVVVLVVVVVVVVVGSVPQTSTRTDQTKRISPIPKIHA